MRCDVIRLNLARTPLFDCITDEDLMYVYNGYGPDYWPEQLRDIITFIYREYTLLAFVHDVEFNFSDGRKESWLKTLDNWEHNMWLLYNHKFNKQQSWYNVVLRLRMLCDRRKLNMSLSLLKKCSWTSWLKCGYTNNYGLLKLC